MSENYAESGNFIDQPQAEALLQSMQIATHPEIPDDAFNRRKFLVGALGFMYLALDQADQAAINHLWPDTPTTLDVYHPRAEPHHGDKLSYATGLLASPGFGGLNGNSICETYQQHSIYPINFPMGSYDFSTRVITKDSIGAQAVKFVRQFELESLTTHGDSEGGLFTAVGARATELPVRIVALNDSPFDIDDAVHDWFAKGVVFAHRWLGYDGGPVGKGLACMIADVSKHGAFNSLEHPGHRIMQAIREGTRGASPVAQVPELVFLHDAHLYDEIDSYNKTFVHKLTKAYYFRTKRAETDETVRIIQASTKWNNFFDYHGVPMETIEVEQNGHDQMAAGITAGAQILQREARRIPHRRVA